MIAYLRVSTQRQGQSGLGLEAQRFAIEEFAASRGKTILGEFVEMQSGRAVKLVHRVELRRAIAAARDLGVPLVVAKLDRLARDTAFILGLADAGVDFIACDFPEANRLTMTILAAVAEYEGRIISERTKAGLAAAKRRGVKLGGVRPGHTHERLLAAQGHARIAFAHKREHLVPVVQNVLDKMDGSYTDAADVLNHANVATPSGRGNWYPATVKRFVDRGEVTPL